MLIEFHDMGAKKSKRSDFGARLKKLREDRDLSQKALAERAGLSSVAMMESRYSAPRYKTAQALAKALGITVEELYGDDLGAIPEALATFLVSPAGRDATTSEIEALRRLQARGRRPTVDTYFWALKMLRSMAEGDKDG